MPDELRLTFETKVTIPDGDAFAKARIVLRAEEASKAAHAQLVEMLGDVPWEVTAKQVTPRKKGDEPAGENGGGGAEG